MSFRTIAGNEWRDLGTTGRGRHGAAETAGYPTMHSSVMYGQVEHETGKGRRSGFTGGGMGHIGAIGGPAAFGSNAIRRSGGRSSVVQDPAIDLSPAIRRSDSFSSNAGWDSGRAGAANRSSKTELRYSGGSGGGGQTVCKREAFYVVEDRPVIIARTEYIREHRLYEVEFVKETYFNTERELVNDQPSEIVEQKERIISVTQPDPCSCVTGNEYGISYSSGIPRSRRGSRAELF